MRLPENRTVLLVGGVALAAGALYLIANHGREAGAALGRGAGQLAGGAASGVVFGLGDAMGLSDTTDPVTVSEGRAALERGELLTASRKLPAMEFLSGVGSRLGIWVYNATHADEARDLNAGAGSVTTDFGELTRSNP